jgi:hypothetical protein
LLVVVAAAGLSSGVVLILVAVAIALVTPPPPGMVLSVRANGANWLPYAIEPALLTAGWVILVMRWRGEGGRLTCAVAALAGLVDISILALLLVWAASPHPDLDRKPSLVPVVLLLLLGYAQIAWAFLAPALAALPPVRASGPGASGRSTLQALALLPVAMAAGAYGFAWTTSVLLP